MQAKIGVLPACGCDRAAVGVIFESLRKKWPDEVFLVWWPVPSIYPSFDVPVLVLIANNWEMLCEMRASIVQQRVDENVACDGCYVCGFCLGEAPAPLTNLPNYTVHTDMEDLEFDIASALGGLKRHFAERTEP